MSRPEGPPGRSKLSRRILGVCRMEDAASASEGGCEPYCVCVVMAQKKHVASGFSQGLMSPRPTVARARRPFWARPGSDVLCGAGPWRLP